MAVKILHTPATLARFGWFLATAACLGASSPAPNATPSQAPVSRGTNEFVTLPEPIGDPIEPVNRAVWAFNRAALTKVVQPTARVYRFIVRRPIRMGINNLGRNVTYPGRLINHLLQARWTGARDETCRFGVNTVLGLGGIFDLASQWDIPKSDADFGQTFGKWGWQPSWYLMLPLFGPSNERDTVGMAADTAANPLSYVSPYPFSADQPLTYASPYTYYGYLVTYNTLSDTADEYARLIKSQKDAYADLRYVWSFARRRAKVEFESKGPPDPASLETMQSTFVSFLNPEFPRRARTELALIYTTGYRLPYTFWLQPERAAVVYIVPGLGSHRLATAALALAERLYNEGFSVVCISSPFNYEFMERAGSTPLPGYARVDTEDLHVALTAVDSDLGRRFPGRIGARVLLGYSMGGFESLTLAASGLEKIAGLTSFDRFIAINPPVRLLYGVSKLDSFFNAPLAWPAAERNRNMENTFLKVAALIEGSYIPQGTLPFSAIESRFLVGTVFRFILRDTIVTSQQRYDQGVLKHSFGYFRRDELYREIERYSFQDYYDQFVIPYYEHRGIGSDIRSVLAEAADLRTYAEPLRNHSEVRVIVNRNDFLLDDSDLQWLQTTFGPSRLTIFEHGGHLGNLQQPEMAEAILRNLESLPRARAK